MSDPTHASGWRDAGLRRLAALTLASALTGCAEVAVWERGNLAKPQMALEPFPANQAYYSHAYQAREAASGGENGAGGGCGCY